MATAEEQALVDLLAGGTQQQAKDPIVTSQADIPVVDGGGRFPGMAPIPIFTPPPPKAKKQTFGGAMANAFVGGGLGTAEQTARSLEIVRERNQETGARLLDEVTSANRLDDDQFDALIGGIRSAKGIEIGRAHV